MRRQFAAIALSIAAVVSACGDGDTAADGSADGDSSQTTTTAETRRATTTTLQTLEVTSTTALSGPPTNIDGFRQQEVACDGELPEPPQDLEFEAPEDMAIDPASRPVATITTSCGDIVVELDPSIAPATVNSFVFLAESGYFDGTASHRILPGFVIQAGDPSATGLGRPGYTLPDEFPGADFVYERGTIAMANAGPGTGGSQFFLMLDDAGLPPQFSVFGEVVAGLDVMDRIAEVPLGVSPRGEESVPLESVFIESVTVER